MEAYIQGNHSVKVFFEYLGYLGIFLGVLGIILLVLQILGVL